MSAGAELLAVRDLRVHFPVRGGLFSRVRALCRAVDGVSLTLRAGETLGLVGESGCGKSTLGRAIVGINTPTAGGVWFDGVEVSALSPRARMPYRRDIGMIFQDPADSLNPRHTVGEIVAEPLVIHRVGTPAQRRARVGELLDRVGLPRGAADKFPFEFSGGQRQRVGIARALALGPRVIVCDEPVSALDVSIQGQVLNLLLDLQRELGLAYLFIAHDLSVVRHMSDRMAVMYLGRVVESGDADAVWRRPLHAYTRALISAVPTGLAGRGRPRAPIVGEPPSPLAPPPGCAFGYRMGHPRYAETLAVEPRWREVEPGRWVLDCPCCRDAGTAGDADGVAG